MASAAPVSEKARFAALRESACALAVLSCNRKIFRLWVDPEGNGGVDWVREDVSCEADLLELFIESVPYAVIDKLGDAWPKGLGSGEHFPNVTADVMVDALVEEAKGEDGEDDDEEDDDDVRGDIEEGLNEAVEQDASAYVEANWKHVQILADSLLTRSSQLRGSYVLDHARCVSTLTGHSGKGMPAAVEWDSLRLFLKARGAWVWYKPKNGGDK